MAGRSSKHSETPGDAELMHTLRAAAQQIWLAGLSALVRTQEEGGKVLGALKNEGRRGGRSARDGLAGLGNNAGRAASQATRGASATIDRLEHLFESGIGRTLERLGVPTAKDMHAINERLDALEGRATPRKQSASARPTNAAASARKRAGSHARAKSTAKTAAKKRAGTRTRPA